jgi:hypothetical protein
LTKPALQIGDRIAQRNPDDPVNLEALAISHMQTAKVLLQVSRDVQDEASRGRATNHLRECVRITKIILAFDPEHKAWADLLAEAEGLLATPTACSAAFPK